MSRAITPDKRASLLDSVRAIYKELANRPVERNCTNQSGCCHFKLTGRTPFLTRGEAIVAAGAMRAAGKRKLVPSPSGVCPLLYNGRCSIYEGRPFGCRSHFCKAAGGPLARGEVRDLIQKLDDIDHTLGGNGGVNLPTAVQWALQEIT